MLDKLTIETKILKDLVGKTAKGALGNKNLKISNLLQIKAENGILSLHTNDIDNHLIVSADITDNSSFSCVVDCDLFCRLIQTFEKDSVTLSKADSYTQVSQGSNKYKFPIPLDESGAPVVFEDLNLPEKFLDISYEDLSKILTYLPSALSSDYVVPMYTGYYIDDVAISTNRFKVCYLPIDLLKGSGRLLLPSKLVHLLKILQDNNLRFGINEFGVFFITDNAIVCGLDMKEGSSYPKDALLNYIKSDLPYQFKFKKSEFLFILNRLGLFISNEDKATIVFTPKADKMDITTLKELGEDSVKIEWLTSPIDNFSGRVDYNFLKPLIEVMEDDYIIVELGAYSEYVRLRGKDAVQILTFTQG